MHCLADGRSLTLGTIGDLNNILGPYQFSETHQGYSINPFNLHSDHVLVMTIFWNPTDVDQSTPLGSSPNPSSSPESLITYSDVVRAVQDTMRPMMEAHSAKLQQSKIWKPSWANWPIRLQFYLRLHLNHWWSPYGTRDFKGISVVFLLTTCSYLFLSQLNLCPILWWLLTNLMHLQALRSTI